MRTTMRKRTTGLPPAYSHREEAKRMAVARARPRTISRLSLMSSTSVLVGTFCPPILSIAHLGNRQDILQTFRGSFRLQIAMGDGSAVFRGHAFYVGRAIGRQASIANLVQERAIADLERFRSAATIPVMGLQYLENDFFFKTVHGLAGDLLERNRAFHRDFKVEVAGRRLSQVSADAGFRPKDHIALDQVFQLADVARPVIRLQEAHERSRERKRAAVIHHVEMSQEIVDQLRNVRAAFPQRRQRDVYHVNAIEEIFTEVAGGNFTLQVTVGGADYARFRPRVFFRADAAEFSVLQNLQELGLKAQAEFANFIQKERAAIGQRYQAGFGGNRSGKRTLFIAKKFAFKQRVRNGGAVHLYVWPFGHGRAPVNQFGDNLFTAATGALNKDRDIR